jgi:hypothetical protein
MNLVRKYKLPIVSSLFSLLVFASCATGSKTAVSVLDPESSSVQAESSGLAPSGDKRFQKIDFDLAFGSPEAVIEWRLDIIAAEAICPTRSITGDGTKLPDRLSWDGRTASGSLAAEGNYYALLSVDYGDKFMLGEASTEPFVLDIAPPGASFAPNPARFDYSSGVELKPISVTLTIAPGIAKPTDWRIALFDPAGRQIKSFKGNLPCVSIEWDGRMDSGTYVQAGATYTAVLTVSDEYGNRNSVMGAFTVTDLPDAQTSAITSRRHGFSAASASIKNTIDLLLDIGPKASAPGWHIDIGAVVGGLERTVRSFPGPAIAAPDFVRRNGSDSYRSRYISTRLFFHLFLTSQSGTIGSFAPRPAVTIDDAGMPAEASADLMASPLAFESGIRLSFCSASPLALSCQFVKTAWPSIRIS